MRRQRPTTPHSEAVSILRSMPNRLVLICETKSKRTVSGYKSDIRAIFSGELHSLEFFETFDEETGQYELWAKMKSNDEE